MAVARAFVWLLCSSVFCCLCVLLSASLVVTLSCLCSLSGLLFIWVTCCTQFLWSTALPSSVREERWKASYEWRSRPYQVRLHFAPLLLSWIRWVGLLEKVRWRFSVFSSSWWRSSGLWLRGEAVRHCQNLIWRSAVWEGRCHSNTRRMNLNYCMFTRLTICNCSSSQSPAAPDCPMQGSPRRSFASLRGRDKMQKWGHQLMRSTTTQVHVEYFRV